MLGRLLLWTGTNLTAVNGKIMVAIGSGESDVLRRALNGEHAMTGLGGASRFMDLQMPGIHLVNLERRLRQPRRKRMHKSEYWR